MSDFVFAKFLLLFLERPHFVLIFTKVNGKTQQKLNVVCPFYNGTTIGYVCDPQCISLYHAFVRKNRNVLRN